MTDATLGRVVTVFRRLFQVLPFLSRPPLCGLFYVRSVTVSLIFPVFRENFLLFREKRFTIASG